MYLVFYISVILIIFALINEVKVTRSEGYVHTQGPATTVIINQQIPLQPQPQPQYPQQGDLSLSAISKQMSKNKKPCTDFHCS